MLRIRRTFFAKISRSDVKSAPVMNGDLKLDDFLVYRLCVAIDCCTHSRKSGVMTETLIYRTALGEARCGNSLNLLQEVPDGSVNLVMTSPPFALQRQKEYGNKDQHEYIDWLCEFAALVHRKLRDDGSFVLDLGGAYQKGAPTRSLYNFRIPIKFCDELGFFLAEDFYWFNPAKLPSPIEWVNKRKLRAKDAVRHGVVVQQDGVAESGRNEGACALQ